MPRNGAGVYTPPNGTLGVTGQAISSSAYNAYVADNGTEITNSVNVAGTAAMTGSLNMGSQKIIAMAAGSASTDGANMSNLSALMPAGTVMMYAASTPPTGWLECNGASLSTTTYATLFAVIGYTFGGGGANFSLPDLRGEFIRGYDHGRGVDAGRSFGSAQADALASHTHTATDSGHTHTATDSGHTHTFNDFSISGSGASVQGGAQGHYTANPTGTGFATITVATGHASITVAATGGTETTVKNIALLPCIKY